MKLIFSQIFLLFSTTVFAIGGSTWVFTDDNSKSIEKLNFDGTCTYYVEKDERGIDGKIHDNCKWMKKGNLLIMEYNDYYAIRIGKVNGRTLEGYWISNLENSYKGSFSGEMR